VGGLFGNRSSNDDAGRTETSGPAICAVVDTFPESSQAPIIGVLHALRGAGIAVRIEARSRAAPPSWPAARELDVRFWEDDGPLRRAADLNWITGRHPRAVAHDVLDRRCRRSEQESSTLRVLAPAARRVARRGEHVFYAGSGTAGRLDAIRLARISGIKRGVPPELPQQAHGSLTAAVELEVKH
jgi:hypothetical protein